MGEFAQQAAGAEEHVDAVDAGVDGDLGVVHVTADVGQDLGLEAQPGDALAVGPALGAGHRRGQFEVLDAECVQQAGDLHLLVAGEEGVGELLALAQRRFDDGKILKTHGSSSS